MSAITITRLSARSHCKKLVAAVAMGYAFIANGDELRTGSETRSQRALRR